MNNKYIIIHLLLLLFNHTAFARTIGSNTVVSREPQAAFTAADTNNLILGFAYIENGIVFEAENLSCAIDVLFPMSGGFVLNNGTLNLNRSMYFEKQLNLGGCTLNGNDYSVYFPNNQKQVELPSMLYGRLLNDLFSLTVDDVSYSAWSFDSKYVAVTHTGADNQRLRIYEFDGTSLTLVASQTYGNQDDPTYVGWHPSQYFLTVGRDDELEIFSFNEIANTLTLTDSRSIDLIHAAPWSPDGNYVAAEISTNFIIYSVSNGIITNTFSSAPLQNSRQPSAENSISWSGDGSYLGFGTVIRTGPGNQRFGFLEIYSFNGSVITYETEVTIDRRVRGMSVSWQPGGQLIATGVFNVQGAGGSISSRLKLHEYSITNNSLTEITTAAPGEDFSIFGLKWSKSGIYLSSLRDASAGLSDLRIFTYNKNSQVLEIVAAREDADSYNIFSWAPNEEFFCIGSPSDGTLILINFEVGLINFIDTHVVFNSDMVITTTIKFEGNCSIDGNNNLIELSSGCIQVANDASLDLSNAIVNDVQNNNIFCTNNAGILSLKNVEWNLLNDYTFTIGALSIQDKFRINSNQNSFIYSSSQSSTVQENSELILGVNTEFSYAPPIANKGLFQLESGGSILTLESGSTLHSTSTGLRFENGIIRVSGSSAVKSDGIVEAESIDLSTVVLEWLTGGVVSIEGQVKI